MSGRRRTCIRGARSAPRRPPHPTTASAPSRTEPATRARRRRRSRPRDPPAPRRESRRRCRCRIAPRTHPRSGPGSPRCGRHPWDARSFPSCRRSRRRRRAVGQDRTRQPRGQVASAASASGIPTTTLPSSRTTSGSTRSSTMTARASVSSTTWRISRRHCQGRLTSTPPQSRIPRYTATKSDRARERHHHPVARLDSSDRGAAPR